MSAYLKYWIAEGKRNNLFSKSQPFLSFLTSKTHVAVAESAIYQMQILRSNKNIFYLMALLLIQFIILI